MIGVKQWKIKCISKPSFISQKIFSKNFVAIHQIKHLSNIYQFHYKYIKSKFDSKLLCIDTDSLIDEIKTEDVYEDFYEDKNLFNFSDYPLKSKFFAPAK